MDINDTVRWDNMVLRAANPFVTDAWSGPVHFSLDRYDTSPFWDEDETVFVQGSHPWEVRHLEDGYYYLIIAEGGTALNHMETAARSKQITRPFTPAPHNPLLTNANTSDGGPRRPPPRQSRGLVGSRTLDALGSRVYFISHGAQVLQVPFFARSVRRQGRETVLTNATWAEGEWPVFENVSSIIGGPILPSRLSIPGDGPWITAPDSIDLAPNSALPLHFAYPDPAVYLISPPGHENTLRLLPSLLNLTGFGENSAPTGQTFVGRRQVHSQFVYSVDMEYAPQAPEEEAGVSVFLTQRQENHHIDFGVVCLANTLSLSCADSTALRIRTTSSTAVGARPDTIIPLAHPQTTRLEIRADNLTHYTSSYSQTSGATKMRTSAGGSLARSSVCMQPGTGKMRRRQRMFRDGGTKVFSK
ncbi:Glycoside hydrolase family 43 protein [Mycena sanguinolenta]|uniref:Glycoside hydrolase family 43 protein n=1 Tax=Mycena sanguinolenta TaxID=230812 RepID=A0A8H6YU25_9AGAR|nr:Glycoside hydrolase family 43 protein [Mycena sanguinolenta]